MPFEPPELPGSDDEATDRILDGLQDRLDGWVPREGDPLVALGEEVGRESTVAAGWLAAGLAYAVAGVGETAFGFPAFLGTTTTITVDITVAAAGETIPAGFAVIGTNPAGVEVAFELLEPVTTAALTTSVTMSATGVGDDANGVPVGAVTVITATATVTAATATAASSGGADPETQAAYLDRLVDYLSTLRPGGVRADDLATLARSVPGVHRVLGVDLHDPATPGVEVERTVTVFPIDENGAPVSAAVATEVEATLEAAREVNFVVHVAAPTYTAVNVEYAAVAEDGADPATVKAAIDSTVLAWLADWGTTPADDTAWEATNTVRFLELARVAGSAPGVAYLSSLTLNGGTGDLALAGVAALPAPPDHATTPSTVIGTVS